MSSIDKLKEELQASDVVKALLSQKLVDERKSVLATKRRLEAIQAERDTLSGELKNLIIQNDSQAASVASSLVCPFSLRLWFCFPFGPRPFGLGSLHSLSNG